MIETVASLFPQISRDNIRRDLTETGNVNLTIDRIVECRGSVFGRNSSSSGSGSNNSNNRGTGGEKKRDGPLSSAFKEILSGIQQKEKQQQMKSAESAVASSSSSSSLPTVSNSIGGEWSQDPVQRMTQLRLRKERMLLEARQKFQKNQQQEKDSSLLSPQ